MKQRNKKSKRNTCPDCNEGKLVEVNGHLLCPECEAVFMDHKEVEAFHRFHRKAEVAYSTN